MFINKLFFPSTCSFYRLLPHAFSGESNASEQTYNLDFSTPDGIFVFQEGDIMVDIYGMTSLGTTTLTIGPGTPETTLAFTWIISMTLHPVSQSFSIDFIRKDGERYKFKQLLGTGSCRLDRQFIEISQGLVLAKEARRIYARTNVDLEAGDYLTTTSAVFQIDTVQKIEFRGLEVYEIYGVQAKFGDNIVDKTW